MPTLLVYGFLLALPVASALQAGLQSGSANFQQYVASFGRDYQEGTVEFTERQTLFEQRMRLIAVQNSRSQRLWTAEVNAFTDRTDRELADLRGWRHIHQKDARHVAFLSREADVASNPAEEVDWRSLSFASTAPHQGVCGSCWAFATATMLQGRYEIQTNQSRTFSAQQLVDCVPNPQECGGSGGCRGATVELALEYVARMGLHDEITRPYSGMDQTCQDQGFGRLGFLSPFSMIAHRSEHRNAAYGLKTWHRLPENKALPLMLAVMDGPVAVSVAASRWAWYGRGIFDGCAKNAVIDHAVVLFGYGSAAGVKYWTVRNSWGDSWGERGYMRLLRHATPAADDEHCGTDKDPSVGLACKPYPKSVRVCGMCGLLYDSVVASFK